MKQYDFDEIIERKNTNSLKFDCAALRGLPEDTLPLWVADMDFRAPNCVLEALQKCVDHGIFGYSEVNDSYAETVAAWFDKRFGWKPEKEWLVKTPGVVYALAMAVRALTEPGDAIIIQPPVYYPFYSVVRDNGRVLVENELIYSGGRYSIDFADFERKITEHNVRAFILCSPHNPTGRVWTREELRELGSICQKHGVFVLSDEIHCDFAFPGHEHSVFAQACPELAGRCVIFTAPSKSFNIAGLQVSNIWIPGGETRQKFKQEINASGYSQLNSMGLAASRAAYAEGGPWLEQCSAYMRANLDYLCEFLCERLPEIKLVEPEGTYFAWLDCSGLGLTREELNDLIIKRARLWLDAGHIFGEKSEQFQRIVLACPRSTLTRALEQLEAAVRS
ncbi:MAG: pyridoxal phosphate-dependent aminotransferase [Butyricicoccus sp.]|nr:pyridoxal phosphate-dependent aminotransferase [Butyricicoccus sp.]